MSAFLCSTMHFQGLATTLAWHAESKNSPHWTATHRLLSRVLGADYRTAPPTETRAVVIDVINQLYNLNKLALSGRYGGRYARGKVITVYDPNLPLSSVQFFKALTCLGYQCCEPLACDTRLYPLLDAYTAEVATDIVKNLPEYHAADWDLADEGRYKLGTS